MGETAEGVGDRGDQFCRRKLLQMRIIRKIDTKASAFTDRSPFSTRPDTPADFLRMDIGLQ
jgi:hypothetical protein